MITCEYANPSPDSSKINYHFDANSMTVLLSTDELVVDFVSNGGIIGNYIPPPPFSVIPHLNSGALIRFTATNPITVLENIGMAGVSRVAKGRFRVTHAVPMPSDQYSVFPDVMDIADKRIRYTARTTDYVEVRVVDATGAAADAQEVSLKVERVIAS